MESSRFFNYNPWIEKGCIYLDKRTFEIILVLDLQSYSVTHVLCYVLITLNDYNQKNITLASILVPINKSRSSFVKL